MYVKTLKGGGYYNYVVLSSEGFNGGIITPNLPFISADMITKVGTEANIEKEMDAYRIIRKLNDNQYQYDRMSVKILCEPPPLSFPINRDLFDDININTGSLVIKPEFTHAMIMKRGETSLKESIKTRKYGLLECLVKIKDILNSLGELNKNGYIHGDIKLNNILVYNDQLYLLDFGTFVNKQNFIDTANTNSNELSIFLKHIPFESQFINYNGGIFSMNSDFLKKTLELYYYYLSPYIRHVNMNDETITRKINNDILQTIKIITSNKVLFLEKLFNTFDVFSMGLSLLVLLDKFKVITNEPKYIEPKYIEPKYIELYKLIYEKCFTYNLHERITMDEFIRLYNNIVS
jgi:tRNA A-37 threonylcarbamoyl transferase component Bud32